MATLCAFVGPSSLFCCVVGIRVGFVADGGLRKGLGNELITAASLNESSLFEGADKNGRPAHCVAFCRNLSLIRSVLEITSRRLHYIRSVNSAKRREVAEIRKVFAFL